MRDWWDTDSRHPANQRDAEYGLKSFVCTLDNGEELLTFLGEVDFRLSAEGVVVGEVRFWPENEDFREAIEEYVSMNLF